MNLSSLTVHVIDTETCGRDAGPDRVVEVAIVPLLIPDVEAPCDATIVSGGFFDSFVAPAVPISFGAMGVHHITDAMVAGAPTLTEALRAVYEVGAPKILSAHNAAFDAEFLKDALEEVCAEREVAAPYWLDTYRLAKHKLPNAEGYSNQSLRYELGLDHPDLGAGGAHRALGDALVTALLLRHLLTTTSLRELCAVQHQPVAMKAYPFGKHRAQPIEEVPEDYLRWVKNKSDLGQDEKYTAEVEIERRWREKNAPLIAAADSRPAIPVTSGLDELRASIKERAGA